MGFSINIGKFLPATITNLKISIVDLSLRRQYVGCEIFSNLILYSKSTKSDCVRKKRL